MPRKSKEPAKLSIEQLQSQLAQIEVDRTKLNTALEERRAAELSAFAQLIREQIIGRGYGTDEVIALLKRRRKAASSTRGAGRYVRYVDPDNPSHSYVRGPIPRWLGEKMEEAGFDPGKKEHREEFKSAYLKQVG